MLRQSEGTRKRTSPSSRSGFTTITCRRGGGAATSCVMSRGWLLAGFAPATSARSACPRSSSVDRRRPRAVDPRRARRSRRCGSRTSSCGCWPCRRRARRAAAGTRPRCSSGPRSRRRPRSGAARAAPRPRGRAPRPSRCGGSGVSPAPRRSAGTPRRPRRSSSAEVSGASSAIGCRAKNALAGSAACMSPACAWTRLLADLREVAPPR